MSVESSAQRDARPIEFQLSDAPIHRIQTLSSALHGVLCRIPGFTRTTAAVFVRRDFDSVLSDSEVPVFNATFYREDLRERLTKRPFPKIFQRDTELEALHHAALNSLRTPRAALERAVRRLKEIASQRAKAGAKEPTSAGSVEEAHHWLELYSRVTYQGGLPTFVVDEFKCQSTCVPAISLAAVRRQGNDFYGRLLPAGASMWRAERILKPLTVSRVADPLYREVQQVIDPTASDDSGQSPSDDTATREAPEQYLFVLPLYDLMYSESGNASKSNDSAVAQLHSRAIPCGAFLGLLFLPLGEPIQTVEEAKEEFEEAQRQFDRVAHHLNAFAFGFLQAEFDEILSEDYSGDDPLQFVATTLHRVDGWRARLAKQPPVGPISICDKTKEITVDLRPDFFSPASSTLAVTLSAVTWTCWDIQHSAAIEAFKLSLARRVRYFYEQAILQHSKQQNAILFGQTRAAHGITRTIDQVLSETAALANAIEGLKASPACFPIRSFEALPGALRSFQYPVPLYSIAMENACRDGIDEDNFRRWIPRIEWIDGELETVGISEDLLRKLARELSKPLARNSRRRYSDDYVKVDLATLSISGWEEPLVPAGDVMMRKLLLVVIGELLTEAFQHCDIGNPLVYVTLHRTPILEIVVENSTTLAGVENRLERCESGNQRKATAFFMQRLPDWILEKASVHANEHSAIPLWKRSIKQAIHQTTVIDKPDRLELVSGFGGQTVLWVDDRALLSKSDIDAMVDKDPNAKRTELWPMDSRWIASVHRQEDDFVPEDKAFQQSAIELCRICRERRFNLSLTNFKNAHRIAELHTPFLYLLDLQNATQALGFTAVRSGSTDESWPNWEIYGAEFATFYEIPKTRFRFLTRYRDDRDHIDQVVTACQQLFGEDFEYLQHCVPLSGNEVASAHPFEPGRQRPGRLTRSFEQFLQSNSYSKDPFLNEAIVFAISPPDGDRCWIHNRLHPETLMDGEPTQNRLLAAWLGEVVDADSAKALLLSGRGWEVEPLKGMPYPIACSVFEAVCKKIGIGLEMSDSVEQTLAFPCSPGFPFLIALGTLFFEMKNDREYHGPEKAMLSRSEGLFILTLPLRPYRKDDPTKAISIPEFKKAYEHARSDPNPGRHLVTARLVDLIHARVTLAHPVPGERATFFKGATENGSAAEIAAVEFEDGDQKAILVKWPSNP